MELSKITCVSLTLWTVFLFSCSGVDGSHGEVRVYPLIVKVRFEIDEIRFVDDHAGRMSLRLMLVTEWEDLHLKYGRSTDEETFSKTGFNPDLFMDTEEETNSLQRYTQATGDGKIQQLHLMASTFVCRMQFNWLPIDTQTCSIVLRSSTYDKHVLFLSWVDDPVSVPVNGNNANFTPIAIERSIDGDCLRSADSTDFSCLRISFIFQRNYHNFLIRYIAPTALFAIVAWLSMFVRCSSIRATLVTVCVFAIGFFILVTYANLACPWCLKLLDVWTFACGGIVLLCFFEFLVVQFAFKRQVSGRKKYTINDIKPNCVDTIFRVTIGALLGFVIMFYFTFIYVATRGRGNLL